MLQAFADLRGLRIRASDEPEGSVEDLYVDERDWRVRWLVADVGFWVFGHRGLIAADMLDRPNLDRAEWPVRLTADAIRNAPRPYTHPTVSRQREDAVAAAAAQVPGFVLGLADTPWTPLMAEAEVRGASALGTEVRGADSADAAGRANSSLGTEARTAREGTVEETHLRSLHELSGYAVVVGETSGEEVGTAADFLIDPEGWRIRHLVADTGHWLLGRRIVLPAASIRAVEWDAGRIVLDLARERIAAAPTPDTLPGLERPEEAALLAHYGLPPYW